MKLESATVINIQEIPGFRRITAKIDSGPVENLVAGAYIKIAYENGDQFKFRSITISSVDHNEFKIDFVQHDATGFASRWQSNAQVGDQFRFKKPGRVSLMDYSAKTFFCYADSSALPALSVHLKELALDPMIYICFEGDSKVLDDYLSGINYIKTKNKSDWLEKISEGDNKISALWVAGERLKVQEIRTKLDPSKADFLSFYVSSYWQEDKTDEEHRALKST